MTKNNIFSKHIIGEMDENKIQRCILCGEVVFDYSNVYSPDGEIKPWESGVIYIGTGNPKTIISDYGLIYYNINKMNVIDCMSDEYKELISHGEE